MKSEERRHLAENDLEQTLHHWLDWIEPHANRILLGVVGVTVLSVGAILWYRMSQASADAGWADLTIARTPESMLDVAKQFPDTRAAQWAELRAGRMLYDRAVTESLTNRRASEDDFSDAKDLFSRLTRSDLPAELREIALDGLARTLEATCDGDTSQAIEAYETLVREYPNSVFRDYAQHRIEALKQPGAKEFYAWFSRQNPKPIERPSPLDGTSAPAGSLEPPVFDLKPSGGESTAPALDFPGVNPFEPAPADTKSPESEETKSIAPPGGEPAPPAVSPESGAPPAENPAAPATDSTPPAKSDTGPQ